MPVLSEVEEDGNLTVLQVLHLGNVVDQSLPSLGAGFLHLCRNAGLPTFVYNDERGAWERLNGVRAWLDVPSYLSVCGVRTSQRG